MCGGAIIFDYIPARRRVSTADFWPGSEADAEDIHASHSTDPQRGKPCFRLSLLSRRQHAIQAASCKRSMV
jgi:hypothetical protein